MTTMRLESCVLFFSLVLMTLTTKTSGVSYEEYLERALDPQSHPDPVDLPGITCELDSPSSCPGSQCCVKEVISFLDMDRDSEVRTTCQPLRTQGELCLRNSEGYLCDCAKGLQCAFKNNETYGHCALIESEQENKPSV